MTEDEKAAHLRQMSEAERLRDSIELAAWRLRIDGIMQEKRPHVGRSKFVGLAAITYVRNVISGREKAPFPNAPCYLDEIQRGL